MSLPPVNNQSDSQITQPDSRVQRGSINAPLKHILQTVIALGVLLSAAGITSLCLGVSSMISLPLIILGSVLLVVGIALLILHIKKPPATPVPPAKPERMLKPDLPEPIVEEEEEEEIPLPTFTPPPPPVVSPPPPVEVAPEEILEAPIEEEIQIPRFVDCNAKIMSSFIKSRYNLLRGSPSKAINTSTQHTILHSKTKNLQLCFLKGHPLNDPFLKPTSSAVLLLTNSARDYSLVIGRGMALAGKIEKECWNSILHPGDGWFAPGSVVCGPWENPSGPPPPASHLIFMNPPTLELLLGLDKKRKAITFADFDYKEAFVNCVKAYRDCFRLCRENGISNLQLEMIGLNDLGVNQDEYEKWHSVCALALLEAIRLEENEGERTLTRVTINHQRELPLMGTLRGAYYGRS